MLVGALIVEVFLPDATSLKVKRQVVKSVLQKTKNRFNVSVAELDGEQKWQRATIGMAVIGADRRHLERQLQLALNFLDAEPRWQITGVEWHWS